MRRVGPNDAHINVRLPAALVEALDAWASAIGTSRSAVFRALVEDMIDADALPTVSPTQEQLDVELERLRELTRS